MECGHKKGPTYGAPTPENGAFFDGSVLPPNQVVCPFEIRVHRNFIARANFPQHGFFSLKKNAGRKKRRAPAMAWVSWWKRWDFYLEKSGVYMKPVRLSKAVRDQLLGAIRPNHHQAYRLLTYLAG